ncbi:cytochrome b561 [Roseibium sp. TrichSKD4]|uniref:cytochrome b n=1 Tax=Roseibium sp. TrichSKD4 TaxID=744980 RepID=UPI0001E56F65|nr:cytochrome b [Roseibium sp. TrichSKD4]EFO30378.1 cytochrome b561 [Roseibium sp. TrichSKD4]
MIRNTSTGYGLIAIAFHWSMAVLMIGMLALGIYMHDLPPTDPATYELYQLHKSFGFVILALVVLRLVWRGLNPSPKLPDNMKLWEKAAAHLGHTGLYAVMFALPLSGWMMVSASPWGIPTVVFNLLNIPHLPVPAFLGSKQEVEAVFQMIHEYMAFFTMALVLAHVAAALKHHFITRDTTLRRMISTAPAKADS